MRSPWRRWAFSAGSAMVIVTQGFVAEPVWWQIVVLPCLALAGALATAGCCFGFGAGGATGRDGAAPAECCFGAGAFLGFLGFFAFRGAFGLGAAACTGAGLTAGSGVSRCAPFPFEPSCGTPPLSAAASDGTSPMTTTAPAAAAAPCQAFRRC